MYERRSSLALGIVPCLAASFAVCALSSARAETFRINNVDRAARINMREAPNNRSRVVAYILLNSKGLSGTGNCNDRWCEITYRGSTGWVFRKYLTADPQNDAVDAATAPAPSEEKPTAAFPAPSDAAKENAAAPAPGDEMPVAALPEPSDAAKATADTPQGGEVPVAAPPATDDAAKEIPADLQDKMLRLAHKDGRDMPVYSLPNDRSPVAGRIPADTLEVEDLGTCKRKFCYVRTGSLVGWIHDEDIAKADLAPAPPQAIDNTVPTATQAAPQTGALIDGLGSVEVKTYSLAGISGDTTLPLRDAATETASILGWVPGDAKSVEGLRKCVQKWCLVRYEGLEGWIARRHLADEAEGARRYQVNGVALWGALDVLDYPGPDAAVVGHIPSYASGIVPIGACDRDWCHVRYLGIAGWVSAKFLALQARR